MNKQELLHKWLSNEASPSEMELLKAMPEFELYSKIDAQTKRIEVPNHAIESGLNDLKKQKSFTKISKKKSKVFTLQVFLKLAAILVLIAMSYVFVASIPTNIQAPMAAIDTVFLPDDSKITLQENAKIKYSKYGWPLKREVTLDGEAYFEVAKGKTFTVNTTQGTIQVLGTKFNVSTKNNTLIVSCFEGLVSVHANNITTTISPGNSFTFGNAISNAKVHTTQPTWIFNESNFKNTTLGIVLKEIENQYKVRITTKNIDVNLRYTGSFTHANLDEALRTVTLPLNLSFSKDSTNGVQIFNNKK